MAKLYFRYGTMGSGKSIDLLKVAYNYEEQGKRVCLFTYGKDDRYEKGTITTRIGLQREANVFFPDTNVEELIRNTCYPVDCVLVDEAQFLTEKQVEEFSNMVDEMDIPVICYGLRTDFKLNFFSGSAALMKYADKIEEIKTICSCGKKATINMRMKEGKIVLEGEQEVIGGNDLYRAVCRKCYKAYIKEAEQKKQDPKF